jgi:mRNA interferase RelE/StbE
VKLSWETAALEALLELGRSDRRQAGRVVDAVKQFERSGAGDLRALRGMQNVIRLRVGDWRVIIDADGSRYTVTDVVNRGDAYD